MRKLFLLLAIPLFFAACNDKSKEGKDDKIESKDSTGSTNSTSSSGDVAFPYKATYSSAFEIGDWNLCAKTLENCWQAWSANKLDNLGLFFADTVTAFYGDGEMFSGPRDSLVASWKKYRSTIKDLRDSVHAFLPAYATDKKENWVLIWGTEYFTNDKGKSDSVELQETWRFNKDGKADMLLQYMRKSKSK